MMHHSMSSEIDPRKQRFLMRMMPRMGLLFADARELSATHAVSVNTGKVEQVPKDLFGLVVGFPCTAASGLNSKSSSQQNRQCVKTGELATGEVFQSIVNFIRAHGSSLSHLVLENVLALGRGDENGQSNLDYVLNTLRNLGWFTIHWHLDPRLWGCPVSRPRVWILAFPFAVLEERGLSVEAATRLGEECMNALASSRLAPLESYLLPESHPYVKAVHEPALQHRLQRMGEQRLARVLASGVVHRANFKFKIDEDDLSEDWHEKTLRHYMAQGIQWWRQGKLSPSTLICFPGLARLSDRELAQLTLERVSFPEDQLCSMEVGQRGCKRSSDNFQALIPRGRLYLTSRCRLLTGLEFVLAQGIWYDSPEHLHDFQIRS